MKSDAKARGQINEALEAGGLNYQGDLKVRHICEVLVNDVGIANIKDQVTNPLSGLKVAGWVGCQTVRPFAGKENGGQYTTYDQPKFLDEFTEACGAEPVPYDKARTACCGGSVSIYSPEKTLHLMRGILQRGGGRRRGRDLDALPALPAERGDVSGADQQGVRRQLQYPDRVL